MVLPVVLGGIAIASGLTGLKKGYDAYAANKQARGVASDAGTLFDAAKAQLEKDRLETLGKLASLGALRLASWDTDMGRFVALFERIKGVELSGEAAKDGFSRAVVNEAELIDLRDLSLKAAEILTGGLGALGSGALAGIAAYGGAMTFGAASTGTAISSLAGAAATSATLAWFGGGSLATGGMGMAGGVVILGGLVAGPVLLVGGWALSAKAKANLAKARASLAEAEKAAAGMTLTGAALRNIGRLADQYVQAITDFRGSFGALLNRLEDVIRDAGPSFPGYSRTQKETVWLAVEAAGALKQLLETSLLLPDGSVNPHSSPPLSQAKAMDGKMRE